jgi:hypothetical protein
MCNKMLATLVLLSGTTLIAAAEPAKVTRIKPGEATPIHCAGDYDRDGAVNEKDLVGFIWDFEVGAKEADLDSDGFVDFFDMQLLAEAMLEGCPREAETDQHADQVDQNEGSVGAARPEVGDQAEDPIDLEPDGKINYLDRHFFEYLFHTGDPRADYNRDGFIDFFDIDDWTRAYEARIVRDAKVKSKQNS